MDSTVVGSGKVHLPSHVSEEDFTYYTCVADNLAGLVEGNVSLIPAAPTLTGAITPKNDLDLYIIIAIAAGGLLLLIILIVLICCCVWRRKRSSPKPKVNGDAGGSAQHMEHKHILVVNPLKNLQENMNRYLRQTWNWHF